ncbi:DUF7672 family protein [Aureibaculum conchae]|uniref:DUF7672 family protein n=1 Tax=Aureibaculum sp. 2308TA14-22 TaxID=3108392 RepID=UPI003391FA7D
MLKLYIIGICILIIAILANAIIVKIGLKSWYDFFELLNQLGTEAFSKLSILDYLWLFVGYPFVLGLGYLIGLRVYNFIF